MSHRIVLDLTDMQARGLAMIAGTLGLDDYERTLQRFDSPAVASDEDAKAVLFEAMSAATSALYAALADIGFDVLKVDDEDEQ